MNFLDAGDHVRDFNRIEIPNAPVQEVRAGGALLPFWG